MVERVWALHRRLILRVCPWTLAPLFTGYVTLDKLLTLSYPQFLTYCICEFAYFTELLEKFNGIQPKLPWIVSRTCVCMCVCVCVCVCVHAHAQLYLTLCNLMDCSLPGSSVHGIFQARILQWVLFPPPGDLPNSGTESMSPAAPALAGEFLTTEPPAWIPWTWEAINGSNSRV